MTTGMASTTSFTNDEVRNRILKVYAKFVSDVEPDRLFDWLVQENVITIDQKKRIHHVNPIASDRCRAILDHLFSIQHPRSFLVVRQALMEDNHYLLETIDNQEPEREIRLQPEEQSVLHDNLMRVGQIMKGEMSAKTTYMKSAKGPVAIYECSQDGKYIALENTGRKDEFLGNWSLTRNINGEDRATYEFRDSFVLRPGQKIKVWARGTRAFAGVVGDIESDQNWGVGANVITKLLNPLGEERATHDVQTKYA